VSDADWSDIQACLGGSEDAFARLVKRYEKEIARQMYRFSRDPLVCEELVQDVFVEAYFSLAKYRGGAPFIHWLRRIATRVGYRFWKRRARRREDLPIEEWDGKLQPDETPDPAAAGALLHSLLSRLAPKERLVLTLMYFDGCSTAEIAERTGWTRAMVKMRAYRARKKMKRIAERENLLEKLEWIS